MHADGIKVTMLDSILVSWLGHARRNVKLLGSLNLHKPVVGIVHHSIP